MWEWTPGERRARPARVLWGGCRLVDGTNDPQARPHVARVDEPVVDGDAPHLGRPGAERVRVSPARVGNELAHRLGVGRIRQVEPGDKDDCKDDGWMTRTRADDSTFKNQGDCIQYRNSGK